MKKILWIAIGICAIFGTLWGGTVLKNQYLTHKHGDEFTDHAKLELQHMGAWDFASDLRVLRYSDSEAVVYYFSKDGGEKISFVQKDGHWKYDETLALWSSQGSADDYFIWPYFKHFVP